MKKFGVIVCVLAVFSVALTVSGIILFCLREKAVSASRETRFSVKVIELSGLPITGANVYVCETGELYKTGADGFTAEMRGFIDENDKWGTVTLCVFKEGYVDYVLYGCVVYGTRVRKGVTIRLFRQEEDAPGITVYSENPPDDYSRELMKKARKPAGQRNG